MQNDIIEVKELGERIGYDQLMQIASALWARSLNKKGLPVTGALLPVANMHLKVDDWNHYHDTLKKYNLHITDSRVDSENDGTLY